MIGIIRTIVFIVGAYYIIQFLMKLFSSSGQQKKSSTTHTHSEKPSAAKKNIYKDDAGDFVDYEEIKDE